MSPPTGSAGAASLAEPLLRHPPFDEIEPPARDFLPGRLRLAYFPRGALVLDPQRGAPDRLVILKQGRVQADAEEGVDEGFALGPGECFPIDALLARRAPRHAYRAAEDCFCWELAEPDFRELLERSRSFREYCSGRLGWLLERAERASSAQAAEALLDGASMLAPLRSAISRAPVCCTPDTPVRDVLRTMHRERIGSMVVVDGAGAPVGIFTTHDVLGRVAAPQAPVEGPIGELMTPRPLCLEESAMLSEAAVAMARHGIRHVIATSGGRLTGVVSERDLFTLQRFSLRRTAERIHAAATGEALQAAAQEVRALARQLLAQGVGADALSGMISGLNDALTQRVIDVARAGRPPLPGSWCWLALGSEGRLEQTFVSDQDNALIFVPASGAEGDLQAAREAFLAFAREVNRQLDACGFPLCKGGVMAGNRRWCLTLREWRRVFDQWIENPVPAALLDASIFFDLRPLAGDAALGGTLREAILARTQRARAFCRAMAENALRARPAAGLLPGFLPEELDLKAQGARPFVDAARVFALAAGAPDTGTAARLQAAGERAAVEAFHYIQGLRLRRGNRAGTEALSEIERRTLKEALRQAARLQARLRLEYGL